MPQPAVLVTGATSDIGKAICEKFGGNDYFIFAHARDPERGKQLSADLDNQGIANGLVLADLMDANASASIIASIKTSEHPLEAIVNNAGGVLEKGFAKGNIDDPLETYRINVFVPYELSVLGAELMQAGSIINISSTLAHNAWNPEIPHYASAKAALSHLTKQLAVLFAPSIRVNAVSPGRTLTAAWGGDRDDAEWQRLANDHLIQRWITPQEIADAVWSVHSNTAITGTDLLIDGGMQLKTGILSELVR